MQVEGAQLARRCRLSARRTRLCLVEGVRDAPRAEDVPAPRRAHVLLPRREADRARRPQDTRWVGGLGFAEVQYSDAGGEPRDGFAAGDVFLREGDLSAVEPRVLLQPEPVFPALGLGGGTVLGVAVEVRVVDVLERL